MHIFLEFTKGKNQSTAEAQEGHWASSLHPPGDDLLESNEMKPPAVFPYKTMMKTW